MDKLIPKTDWTKLVQLKVNPDILSAELSVHIRKETPRPTIEQLKSYLDNHGICYGIQNDALMRLASTPGADGAVLVETVARGVAAEKPVADVIEYLISLPSEIHPKVLPDGNVDLRDLNKITNVNEGDPLVRKIPGKKGKSGHNVRGEVILPAAYRPASLPIGLNTVASPTDPNLLVAGCTGSIVRLGNFYNVYKEYEVKGDIDYSTGNLELAGSAKITGTVRPGFLVRVSGNLLIEGDVEDGSIECGGKLIVKGGVIGKGKSSIYAACGIEVRYVNGHKLRTPGTIIIHDECMSAKIQSGEDVHIGGRGVMAGGEAYVFRQMNAKILGAESGIYTDVYFGFDTVLGGRQADIRSEIERITIHNSSRRVELYAAFKQAYETKSPSDLDRAAALKTDLNEDYDRLELLEQEDASITEQRLKDNAPSVVVRDTVYPGVKLASPITQTFVKDKKSMAGTYFVNNGEIVFRRG
ncbi:MAG: DUF342 domain-containing protein [Fibrobacteres bacterium]|nr:DUF342 domain-containing protein [Fibrobacterota bacterium]